MIGEETSGDIRTASTVTTRLYDNSRRTATPPASDKILYRRVWLEKTFTLIQCPYDETPGHLLQKEEVKLKKFDGTVKLLQSYYRRGSVPSCAERGYDRRQFALDDAKASVAVVKQSDRLWLEVWSTWKSKQRKRGFPTLHSYQQPNCANKLTKVQSVLRAQ